MKLEDLFKAGVVQGLGYSPTSSGIKPVHVANGLSRAVIGVCYDPKLLNHALVRWVKGAERHPTEALVEDAGERLGDFADPGERLKLNELRALLKDVIGADDAVFDLNENCSYSLTHRSHVTGDHNDRGTGAFLHRLLTSDQGDGPSPAIALLKSLLDDESDEITAVSWPLIVGEQPIVYEIDLSELPDALSMDEDTGIFVSSIVRELRAGFDRLAAFERLRGSKLHSLRRLVSFASFAIFFHLIHRGLDYERRDRQITRRVPTLLDFTRGGWTPIALASHGTYSLAIKGIERMMAEGIQEVLAEEEEDWTAARVEQFIQDVALQGSDLRKAQKRRQFVEVFRSYAADSDDVLQAASFAIVDSLVDEMKGTPMDFARAIGVRCGLLAPRGRRAVKKRYAPSSELLEVLLAATVRPDEDLELSELANLWWDRWGIMVGARPGDAQELARWAVQNATKKDLAANANALREALIEIGYARRYADGVTIIRTGNRNGL
jgi:hypothetical protein